MVKVEAYLLAVRLMPSFYEAWFNLGVSFVAVREWDKALDAYRRAEVLRPLEMGAVRNGGRVLLELKRYPEAVACFERVLKVSPSDPVVRNDLGEAYRRMGNIGEAERCFLSALKLKPDYAGVCYNLALTYVAGSRPKDAVDFFEKYLVLSPNAVDAERVRDWVGRLKSGGVMDDAGSGNVRP